MEDKESKESSLYERICELHERKGYPKPILENKKGMVGTVVIRREGNNNMKKKEQVINDNEDEEIHWKYDKKTKAYYLDESNQLPSYEELKKMEKKKKKDIRVGYVEPADYIPKEIRKKFKLGEFAEKEDEDDDIEEMLELDEIESEGK